MPILLHLQSRIWKQCRHGATQKENARLAEIFRYDETTFGIDTGDFSFRAGEGGTRIYLALGVERLRAARVAGALLRG